MFHARIRFMKGSPYTKRKDSLLRIIAVAGILVIIFRMVTDYIFVHDETQFNDGYFSIYVYFIMNSLLMVMLVYLLWRPYKLEIVALVAFPYALIVLLDRRVTPLAVNLFAVGMVALYSRGLLRRHPVRKALISVAGFLVPSIFRLRFGTDEFLMWLPDNIVHIFSFGIIFTLLQSGHQLRKKANPNDEVLCLSDFPELDERDKEWIRLALDNTKFDYIAKHYKVSSGTVKNRMRQIYKMLGVSDRLSMIVAYGKCKVVD